jgi:hypothetical protein
LRISKVVMGISWLQLIFLKAKNTPRRHSE